MSYGVVLIPGDGIGPEVCAAAQTILDASGVKIEWREAIAGPDALDAVGDPLPEATLKAVETADATLKGPTATPKGVGFRSVNVALRQRLNLFANYRPARSLPAVKTRFEASDVISSLHAA